MAAGAVAAGAVAAGALVAVTWPGTGARPQAPATADAAGANDAAGAFLDRYVQPDGRVARLDQGGDTVSEGQAYAMLLAVVTGDQPRFARVWGWAVRHLRRRDGLLSWHWKDGAVVDAMPAADADLDAAWALVLAATRFAQPGYGAEGARLGRSILAGETVGVGGRLVLAAGPWAEPAPATVNPGYDAIPAMTVLGSATGDRRWLELAGETGSLAGALTDHGSRLPPDWATVDTTGAARPADAPDRSRPAEYGLSAPRLVAWLATSCSPADRQLAGALSLPLTEDPGAQTRRLEGVPTDPASHPVGLVGAALAAAASGRAHLADALIAQAAALDGAHHSYFGDAWFALGTTLLRQAGRLGACRAGP